VHASVSNHFNQERSLRTGPLFEANQTVALNEWRSLWCGISDDVTVVAEASSNWSDTNQPNTGNS